MTNNILEPLQLARGSHQPGSGKGCAMNVISWENGDTQITDYPKCSDPFLAVLVQNFNDSLAGSDGLLSPEASMLALELGHMTVGTTNHHLNKGRLAKIYGDIVHDFYASIGTNVVGEDFRAKIYGDIVHDFYASIGTNVVGEDFRAEIYNTYFQSRTIAPTALLAGLRLMRGLDFYPAKQRFDRIKEIIQNFQRLTGTHTVTIPEETTKQAIAKMREVCPV